MQEAEVCSPQLLLCSSDGVRKKWDGSVHLLHHVSGFLASLMHFLSQRADPGFLFLLQQLVEAAELLPYLPLRVSGLGFYVRRCLSKASLELLQQLQPPLQRSEAAEERLPLVVRRLADGSEAVLAVGLGVSADQTDELLVVQAEESERLSMEAAEILGRSQRFLLPL